MRALRDLPSPVPDLPCARRGDGLAARPHLPDARGRRGQGGAEPDLSAPSRSLPRLPRVRDRLPLGSPIRLAPRGRTRRAASERAAREAPLARGLRLLGLPRARPSGRGARALQALQALGASRPRAGDGRAPEAPATGGDGGAPRGRSRRDAASRSRAGARACARARRAPHRLRSAPPLPGREPRHGPPPRAGRLRRRDTARPRGAAAPSSFTAAGRTPPRPALARSLSRFPTTSISSSPTRQAAARR